MTRRPGSLASRRDLVVTYAPINSLRNYANNARRHSRKQLGKIARSLDEFGWTHPLLVTRDGEVICGHGRLEAARMRGDAEVPVIVIDDLTEAQRRAYIIADNELAAQSSWDRGMLATELQGLIELGYDVELSGFDTIQIDTLLSIGDEGEKEEARRAAGRGRLSPYPSRRPLGIRWQAPSALCRCAAQYILRGPARE